MIKDRANAFGIKLWVMVAQDQRHPPLLASWDSELAAASSASGLALGPVSDQSPRRRSRFNGGGTRS